MQHKPNENGNLIPTEFIDNYRVNTPPRKGSDVMTDEQLVDQLLPKKVKDILYDGVQLSTQARKAYVDYLNTVYADTKTDFKGIPKSPEFDAVSMLKLLDKKGLDLYKKAMTEERNSKNFRSAVFLKACVHYEGPKWQDQVIFWIGGPSASGKSTGADATVKEVGASVLKKIPDTIDGNDVVFIDGGIERQVSQMRQLTLQVALEKGYPGIKDLEDQTNLKFKTVIKKVALEAGLNLVIPNTFTTLSTAPQIDKFNKKKGIVQIFAEVVPSSTLSDNFPDTVKRMGIGRALRRIYGEVTKRAGSVFYNNLDIGIESKEYNEKYFARGTQKSRLARDRYIKNSPDNIFVEIVNDLMYVRPDVTNAKSWLKCTPDYKGTSLRVSERDFNAWNSEPVATRLDLPDWLKALPTIAPPIIKVEVRGKKYYQGQFLKLIDQVYELNKPVLSKSPSKFGRGFLKSSSSASNSPSSRSSSMSSSSGSNVSSSPDVDHLLQGSFLDRQKLLLTFWKFTADLIMSAEKKEVKQDLLVKALYQIEQITVIHGKRNEELVSQAFSAVSMINGYMNQGSRIELEVDEDEMSEVMDDVKVRNDDDDDDEELSDLIDDEFDKAQTLTDIRSEILLNSTGDNFDLSVAWKWLGKVKNSTEDSQSILHTFNSLREYVKRIPIKSENIQKETEKLLIEIKGLLIETHSIIDPSLKQPPKKPLPALKVNVKTASTPQVKRNSPAQTNSKLEPSAPASPVPVTRARAGAGQAPPPALNFKQSRSQPTIFKPAEKQSSSDKNESTKKTPTPLTRKP